MKKHVQLENVFRLCKVFVWRFGILIGFSIFLTWFLEYRYYDNNTNLAWAFLDKSPKAFWYTALIIFTITLLFYGIFRGPFKSMGILFGLATIFTYINTTKIEFRGAPVLPEDFQLADQAGTLTQFIDVSGLVRMILAVVLAVALGFLLDYLTKDKLRYILLKKPKFKNSKTKRAKTLRKKYLKKQIIFCIVPRVIIIPIAIFGVLTSTDFIRNHQGVQEEYFDWIDATFNAWSQSENYDHNGLVLGFLYNIHKANMQEPKDYSKNTIVDINKKYDTVKEASLDQKQPLKNADYNVIVILNESFYDPTILTDYYDFTDEDPVPNWHKIQSKYPNGYMYSTDYGGGTANVEFEVLTGLSNYWASTVPYTDILVKIPKITSIGIDAKNSGYKTTAIHSFTGEMYKRNQALPKEGFDTFITRDEMKYTGTEGNSGYIKDSELYTEILDLLESDKQKQFIFAITMQNHAPYNLERYEASEYKNWVNSGDEYQLGFIMSYLQTLHNSDKYLGEFLEKLENYDEKTVILFFGDHAAGVFPNVHNSDDKSVSDLSHLTPYFIWSNFKLNKSSDDADIDTNEYVADFIDKFDIPESFIETAENITLPTTTPNCLINTMYNILKIEKTTHQNLLDRVCSKVPILSSTYLADNPPENEKVFKEYELLNYDILCGDQYWFK